MNMMMLATAEAAVNAVRAKVADYFMRCKLIGFDADAAKAVGISVEKIGAIEGNLALASDAIGEEPLAKPSSDGVLPLDAVNPAWKAAVETMRGLVLEAGDIALVHRLDEKVSGVVLRNDADAFGASYPLHGYRRTFTQTLRSSAGPAGPQQAGLWASAGGVTQKSPGCSTTQVASSSG